MTEASGAMKRAMSAASRARGIHRDGCEGLPLARAELIARRGRNGQQRADAELRVCVLRIRMSRRSMSPNPVI
jgi:hypothetical protein